MVVLFSLNKMLNAQRFSIFVEQRFPASKIQSTQAIETTNKRTGSCQYATTNAPFKDEDEDDVVDIEAYDMVMLLLMQFKPKSMTMSSLPPNTQKYTNPSKI